MRNISFMITPNQILDQSKTVTRRNGWWGLNYGDILQPVRKGMGLKKGEKIEKLGGPIRVVFVWRERLDTISCIECEREGFPNMTPAQFVEMFCQSHKGVEPRSVINRIEFEYMEVKP